MIRFASLACLGLAAMATPATAERGQNGAWCLRDDKAGTIVCAYPSMQRCLASKTGNTDDCIRNPRATIRR